MGVLSGSVMARLTEDQGTSFPSELPGTRGEVRDLRPEHRPFARAHRQLRSDQGMGLSMLPGWGHGCGWLRLEL